MFYYLYEIRNNLNGKIYIGVHKSNSLDNEYMGSGKVIKAAIEKYGLENFSKTILEHFHTSEAMFAREKEIVTDEFLEREDVYNLRRGGMGGFDYINKSEISKFKGKKHSDETKAKIAKSLTGKKLSAETKKKISNNNWSKRDPDSQRKHVTSVSAGRIKTEDEIKKISSSISDLHNNGKYSYEHLIGNSNNKGKRWIHKGLEQKMILKSQPLPDGWSEKRK